MSPTPTPTEPRHFIKPEGIVSTGFPSVRNICRRIGIEFDPWQVRLNRAILAKDATDWYAADTVVMSICRQSGKTFDIGALVFADCILHPGTTTVWTAHRFKVARETFNDLRELAKSPELAPYIDYEKISTAAGNEAIPFRNGSRIVFAARERGQVRGFSKVRRLILDEGQILTSAALSDMAPTMAHATNPQIIIMGTPPGPNDPGEVFTELRQTAIDGSSEGVLYLEYGADPDCDIDDWDALADANPSYPTRTTRRAVRRLRKLLSDDDYRREALGIWAVGGNHWLVPREFWLAAQDLQSKAMDRLALGIEVGPDSAWTSIGLAGQRADGNWHLELIERKSGVDWVVPLTQAVLAANADIRAVVADAGSPSRVLVEPFKRAKVHITYPKVAEIGIGCANVLSGIVTGALRHTGQAQMEISVARAGKRKLGETGMWVWAGSSEAADVTPIKAATLALFGAQSDSIQQPTRRRGGGHVAVL